MKSSQVIFGNLAYSGNTFVIEIIFQIFKMRLQLTIYGRFPKKNVHNCDVLFVGIVVHLVLIKKSSSIDVCLTLYLGE